MVQANNITRRSATAVFAALCAAPPTLAAPTATAELEDLERRAGGQLGLYAIEIGSARVLAWRPNQRFLMCSTFKLLAAAATLARVEAHQDHLDARVAYAPSDLVEPHPVTGADVRGALPVRMLCEAAVKESDSTAANLLMRRFGGPAALTQFIRSLGDGVTRVDRYELDAISPKSDLDTTSPQAMALSVRQLLFGGVLQPSSAQLIEDWMRHDWRGAHRIRAGVPKTWVVGSKPGTSDISTNDVAVLRPPGKAPVIVATYYRSAPVGLQRREHVLQEAGNAVARWMLS